MRHWRDEAFADLLRRVEARGVEPELAPRQVAIAVFSAVQGCTAFVSALVLLLRDLAFSPVRPVLSMVLACVTILVGWLHLQGRRASGLLAGVILAYAGIIAFSSYQFSGTVTPFLFALPIGVCASIIFLDGALRWLCLGVHVLTLGFAWCTAGGLFGTPPDLPATVIARMHASGAMMGIGLTACVVAISNTLRTIAERTARASRSEVMRKDARLRAALETARVGLFEIDDKRPDEIFLTPTMASVLGDQSMEGLVPLSSVLGLIHAEDRTRFDDAFTALAKNRDRARLRIDVRLRVDTGEYRWFAIRAALSSCADEGRRIIGSAQDIEFLRRAEETLRAARDQAREADRIKSVFIAMMSHEVRTPMNAILASVQILQRSALAEEEREVVDLIADAGRGLQTLLDDLLDISRIETGRLEIAPAPCDVTGLVGRTAAIWRPHAESRRLALTLIAEDGPVHAVVDAGRLRQVLGNLLSNAIKFADAGEVRLRFAARETGAGQLELVFRVEDDGAGVEPDRREAIFSPFEQGALGAERGGAGLGLYISRRIAQLMGGQLELLESDRGAVFELTLPAERDDAPSLAQIDDSRPEAPTLNGLSALVVDDNPTNLRIARLLLETFGLQVETAASGFLALEACAARRRDIILCDIIMPEMDGMTMLQQLRASDSPNRSTPALALTARLNPGAVEQYLDAGFVGVVAKPIEVRALVAAITAALSGEAASLPGPDAT